MLDEGVVHLHVEPVGSRWSLVEQLLEVVDEGLPVFAVLELTPVWLPHVSVPIGLPKVKASLMSIFLQHTLCCRASMNMH